MKIYPTIYLDIEYLDFAKMEKGRGKAAEAGSQRKSETMNKHCNNTIKTVTTCKL